MNTLEREARRAKGGRAPGPTAEGEAESPRAERVVGRGGGGGNPAGTRFFLAGVQAWHAQAEAAHGQMSAVATSLRMALPQAKMETEVGTVAPDLGRVEQAHVQLVERYPPPPPHRLTATALDTNFRGEEQSSRSSAGRSSAGGGG